jgi:hypothetical protein
MRAFKYFSQFTMSLPGRQGDLARPLAKFLFPNEIRHSFATKHWSVDFFVTSCHQNSKLFHAAAAAPFTLRISIVLRIIFPSISIFK